MLHYAVQSAFDDLLACWRAYDDAKRRPTAKWSDLGDARIELDRARDRMHRLRIALYPEPRELEAVVESVWCETLDMVVHLRSEDRDPQNPRRYRCTCGHRVDVADRPDFDRAVEPKQH